MSPVRVKQRDFGISKRIRPEAATEFVTQVSTQAYGAPEVLGIDPESETSVYTNSVDIWSLGCVIYELLVGEHLFPTWGHVTSTNRKSAYTICNTIYACSNLNGIIHSLSYYATPRSTYNILQVATGLWPDVKFQYGYCG